MKLTPKQRAEFFAGNCPKLAGEGRCPVPVGHRWRLSRRVSVEVTGIRKAKKGGWSLQYTVYDQRPDADYYLRPTSSGVAVDEKGRPLPMTPAEEHGYTGNPKSNLAERAPIVPRDYQNVLVTRARDRFMEHRRESHAEEEAAKDLQAVQGKMRDLIKRAVKMGVDPALVIAPIAREIQAQHESLERAA